MKFFPNFKMDLTRDPYQATVKTLDETTCALWLGEPGFTFMGPLALYFPADRLEQVQRIADALNEIGQPAPANSDIAA